MRYIDVGMYHTCSAFAPPPRCYFHVIMHVNLCLLYLKVSFNILLLCSKFCERTLQFLAASLHVLVLVVDPALYSTEASVVLITYFIIET